MFARYQSSTRPSWFSIGLLAFAAGCLVCISKASEIPNAATARVSVAASGTQADRESTGPVVSGDGRFVAFVSWATNLVSGDTNNFSDVFVKDRQTGSIVRASVSTSGVEGNDESYAPTISADGRFVAFTSAASNLVNGDSNKEPDVFVRDLVQGTTVRASVASSGAQANGGSTSAVLSSDGRYIAFESLASNIVGNDTNGSSDVFVRDLLAGTTERVSVSFCGGEGLGASQAPSISADARYVAFASTAENLLAAPGDTNEVWDVFVRDRISATTVRASVSSTGAQASASSFAPSISGDGRYVAFESRASNLVSGDTNGQADVFVRDLQNVTTTRVSVDSSAAQGNQASVHPAISGDGRFVAFASKATTLVDSDTNGRQDAFLHDCVAGTTTRLSVDSNGAQPLGTCLWPAISQDGRFMVFACDATNLISGDTNSETDVFVRGPLF